MNRNQLVLTHGAVFSVGIAAAMIVNSLNTKDIDSSSPATSSSSRAAGNSNNLHSGTAASTGETGKRGDARSSSRKGEAPVDRLSSIVRITDSFERQRALMDLVDTLSPDQYEAVLEQFRSLDHLGESWGEYGLLLRGWAKTDPLAALQYMETQPNNRYGRATILQTWAGKDAAAAEQWALANHTGDGPNPHMAAVIRGVAGNDLPTATRLAESMPMSRERGEAVDAITRALFMQSPEAALAYPASITDDALRAGFVGAIAQRMAGKDADRTATWLSSMDDANAQNRAARTVADALARTDSAKAATWVKTLQPEAQAEAARGVIPVMSGNDITATAQWVSGLAGMQNYDRVVEEFVWSCDQRAPEQSAAWIQGVSNPDQQRRLYHRMLGEWSRRDSNAVREWVTSNDVPNEIRRRFAPNQPINRNNIDAILNNPNR